MLTFQYQRYWLIAQCFQIKLLSTSTDFQSFRITLYQNNDLPFFLPNLDQFQNASHLQTNQPPHLSPPLPQFDGVTLQVTPPTAPAQGLLGRCLLQPHQLHHGHLQAVAQPIPGTWSVVMAEAIRRTTGLLWLVGHNVSCAVIGWSHGQPRAPLGLGQPSWLQGKKKKRLKQKAEAKQNICFFQKLWHNLYRIIFLKHSCHVIFLCCLFW